MKYPPEKLVEIAWKDRNHRCTRREAHLRGVERCELCGQDLPNHCMQLDDAGGTRRFVCGAECRDALMVKSGLAR